MATTSRLDIPLASLADDADVEESVNPGFEHIDSIMARDGQGPISGLPAPTAKLRGAYYEATDVGVLLRCNGTKWRAIVELPVGGVLDWPATSAPPTPDADLVLWVEMLGQTVQRSSFPELAAAWGIPQVAPTFVIPNRAGRAQIGAGAGTQSTSARAVGQVGGAEAHQLTVNELPSHEHPRRASGGVTAAGYDGGVDGLGDRSISSIQAPTGERAVGANWAHNNMQPFNVTRYFVRAR